MGCTPHAFCVVLRPQHENTIKHCEKELGEVRDRRTPGRLQGSSLWEERVGLQGPGADHVMPFSQESSVWVLCQALCGEFKYKSNRM